jgi:hypothetical protein
MVLQSCLLILAAAIAMIPLLSADDTSNDSTPIQLRSD